MIHLEPAESHYTVKWKRAASHKREQLSCRDVVEVNIVTYPVSVQAAYLRSEESVATCDRIICHQLRLVEPREVARGELVRRY